MLAFIVAPRYQSRSQSLRWLIVRASTQVGTLISVECKLERHKMNFLSYRAEEDEDEDEEEEEDEDVVSPERLATCLKGDEDPC